MEDEELDYWTTKEMAGYRIKPDSDSRSESEDEGQVPTPAASPIWEEPVRTPNQRRKSTYRALEGSLPVRSRGEGSPNSTEATTTASIGTTFTSRTGSLTKNSATGAGRGTGMGVQALHCDG